jgi:MerR family transcriptional regulator, redox-sensitive transcriptional activator SoxR
MEQLTIGEMAARSGVPASALRFYEARGLIRPDRSGGNQRRYNRSQLRRVAFIRIAQRVGLSLDEVAEALDTLPGARTPTKADWARLSVAWRARLDEQIGLLQRLRDRLVGCIGCGCLSLRQCRISNPDDELAADGAGPHYLLKP